MDGGTAAVPRPFSFSHRGGRFSDRRGRGGGRMGGGDPKDQGDRIVDPTNPSFDGKRMRRAIHRKTVDYNPSMIHFLENRVFQRDHRDRHAIQPDATYAPYLMPPMAMLDKPMNCVTTKFVRTSTNKFRCPVFCLAWTPEGRRLVTGASSGEFTLWNGLTFNFETILQAHDVSVRAMRWSHNDQWMVTADDGGFIKYWQSNMNNVKMYQGHKEAIRGVSFSPTDSKFATCSDDGTVRTWDFMRCHEEKILRGHGADVKCVDWHPQKGLLASGSKDNQQPVKLWDPRTGTSLATLHAHKHTVMDLRWNNNGQWLLTASRDHLLKIFDIRNLKTDLQTFKGHKKEATSLAWHPIHESLFASGGADGSLMFWMVGCDREVGSMEEAHEGMVWSLDWHPLGHILVSGSNDHTTKFWTRNRPGDEMRDRYNLNNLPTGVEQEILEYSKEDTQTMPSLPGMGLEHGLPDQAKPKEEEPDEALAIPGLDWNQDSPFFKQMAAEKVPLKKVPFARPIPRSFEKAWMGQETAQTSIEKAATKPGLLGMPPQVNPTMALNVLLQGNSGNFPPEIVMNMMTEMQKQPHLMALGQQLLLKHQQDLIQQKNPATSTGTAAAPGTQPPQNGPQAQQTQPPTIASSAQQQALLAGALPPQPPQPVPPAPSQPQPRMPAAQQQQAPQRPALLQTPQQQQMGMRPMGSEVQNQFRPSGPGLPQFRPDAPPDMKPPGMGVPGQFGQPRQPFPPQQQNMPPSSSENFRPLASQPMGTAVGDQDHRRPFPSSGPSASSMPAAMDTDLRRAGLPSAMDQFSADGDQDLRQGSAAVGQQRGFPQHSDHQSSQDMAGDSDMRSQHFYGQDGDDDGYGDQYRDFDARATHGADVDERFLQNETGHGQFSQSDMGHGQFSHSDMGHGQFSQSDMGHGQFSQSDMGHGQFSQSDMGRGQFSQSDMGRGQFSQSDMGRGQFSQSDMGRGQFSQSDMHGFQGGFHDNHSGGGMLMNRGQFEEDAQNRKRSWQEGPGRGGGRGQDSRRSVYNGPAGPIEQRRRGGRGMRGRGGRGMW